jgi:imidazole glycerol-phosphate synthase subunit HisH
MKVGVLDYGVGNLGSVKRALEQLSVKPLLVGQATDIHTTDCLILPGVGNFTQCKNLLDAGGWTTAIKDEVMGYNKPLLGICVGMQLLADRGMEGASGEQETAGLGIIHGSVQSLTSLGCTLRVPHMGWNSITAVNKSGEVLRDIQDGTDFYFVHSYAFVPQSRQDVLAETEYGVSVTAVVGNGHVWGTQFHPEKSSKAGVKVLRNFIEHLAC